MSEDRQIAHVIRGIARCRSYQREATGGKQQNSRSGEKICDAIY